MELQYWNGWKLVGNSHHYQLNFTQGSVKEVESNQLTPGWFHLLRNSLVCHHGIILVSYYRLDVLFIF